ncbi:ABC transporter permease [Microlunatus flavus]|uniref:Peptide/nickel transport system permease protein n=1 Tax=Microlunatus flavus TaxID=1036181 RepID=A0A1H9IYZ1_9ACTN|nr:ABC transporter permease [Microlunatus flavus]SEQ79728.1 peptide/nickel transport system permease protein [Microlunatus flavus]
MNPLVRVVPNGTARHVLGRVGQAVLVLWAAYTVAFGVLYGLPGDPAALIAAGGDPANSSATPEQVAALRAQYGYDQPLLVQYLHHLGAAATGDLGVSPRTGPVAASLAQALPATAQIAALGLVLSVVVGGGLALLATYVRARWARQLLLSLPPLGVSVPTFWVGLLLLQGFSFGLGWFPAFGNDGFSSLVLPAVTLAVLGSALIAQVFARSLRAEASAAYADTARAKGASRARVHLRHTARNASLPTFTITGVLVGQFLAGTVVTETVFSRTGIGQLTATAVGTQDIPLALGVVVLGATVVVTVSLVVDLLYPVLDPRMRRTGRAPRRPSADLVAEAAR